jgi:rod shape-determining protein MreD
VPALLRNALLGVVLFALQWLVLGRLRIFGSYPDVVLLFVAWIGLRQGRRAGSVFGFGLGLLMDAVYGTWGIHMFVKTLVGFLIGQFPVDERESINLQPQQAVLGSLVVAIVHNGLMVAFLALQTQATNAFLVWGLWLGSAAYTALIGLIAALFATR